MGLNITTLKEVTLVELSGDIDGKTAPFTQEQILPLAKEDCRLILDMSRVDYMSSAGLRILLAVRRQIPPSGRIILVGLSEPIRDTMTITGFMDFFTTCETLDEGITAISK